MLDDFNSRRDLSRGQCAAADPPKTVVMLNEHQLATLAMQLITAIRSSGITYTRLVWIGQGAYNVMRLVAKGLDIPRGDIEELGITRYDRGTTSTKRDARYYRVPQGVRIVGRECLLLDDRLDWGNTMDLGVHLLQDELSASVVHLASLYCTDDVHTFPELRSRVITVERLPESTWIEFPWERPNETNKSVEARLISMGLIDPWPETS